MSAKETNEPVLTLVLLSSARTSYMYILKVATACNGARERNNQYGTLQMQRPTALVFWNRSFKPCKVGCPFSLGG